jgi:OPT family oligopeptide transporter
MGLFQKVPQTAEEIAASKPLDVPPEKVLEMTEAEWYAKAFRGDASQLTWRAVLMGSVLGFFLAFTNLYIGLKTGWHLGIALTACILSFSIGNALVKAGIAKSPLSILENNCMQSTASSAGYSTGATLVSAFPALLLLSATAENPRGVHPHWALLAGWVLFTAMLGVTLGIPMKRNMINQERLRFPSGVAAAVTLQSLYSHGAEAAKKARALFIAAGIAALLPLVKDLEIVKEVVKGKTERHGLIPDSSKIFDWLPQIHVGAKSYPLSDFNIKLDHAFALVAAGALIGLRVTLSMMAGAIVLSFFIAPAALQSEWTNAAGKVVMAASKPSAAWKEIGVWVGAPMLVTSGLLSFAFQWRTIARAFRGIGRKQSDDGNAEMHAKIEETEVPLAWFATGVAIAGSALVLLARIAFGIPIHFGILAVLMTFFLALVACRATGETDITPTGAMGKIMQLTYGILIPQSTTANLMTAAVTSGSSSASADLLNDLKSGYLLGAHPRRQFIAQMMGIFTGTIATVVGYFILVPDATALTGTAGKDPAFAAPAAQQWKAVAEVFKVGLVNMHPMARSAILVGIAVGAVLTLADMLSPPKVKKWFPSPTGVGLGLILPFYYALAMFLGAFIAWIVKRAKPAIADSYVVPVSSGLIAGESILGVIVRAIDNFVLR